MMQTITYKRILYISLFLLLAAPFGSRAQEYIPMLKEGNQWNILYHNPEIKYDRTEMLQLGETIIINDLEYVELTGSLLSDFNKTEVVAYLREDIETQKVYLLDDKNAEEGLIYDYDVEVGDVVITIAACLPSITSLRSYNVITAIDTVEIGGVKRRHIFFDAFEYWKNSKTDEWSFPHTVSRKNSYIEGIGSTEGLLAATLYISGYTGSPLIAFKQYGEVVYNPNNFKKDFYWDENPYVTSISPLDVESQIRISLESDQLVIRNDQEADYGIALYTTTGRLILTQRSGGREAVVNLSSLPAGVYLLRVYGEGGEVTKKIQVVK